MELKLYNRVKEELLDEYASRAENNDRDYQFQVEAYSTKQHSGIPKPVSRKIQQWLANYNRLISKSYTLRYYQILALFFTEHVLSQKRARKAYIDQKALVYWMATGSGKTLLMHLNILQYIGHIGGTSAFDELQIIVTTPGVNLIEQHERELGDVVQQLNRFYNNRIKLTIATTGALLNKEAGFFNMPENKRHYRLVLVDEGHIGLSSGGKDLGAFKKLRHDLLLPNNSFLFEYSATYHGIAESHVKEYEEQIIYDYNYYRFFKDGYGKDYAIQSLSDDRFADKGKGEVSFFEITFETLENKLNAYEELVVSQANSSGQLPFTGKFPDKPLLAFMGNTVEDPNKEGGESDEVSDIRKFIVWLAYLDHKEKSRYQKIFNGQYSGQLKLTRSPGIQDEIWLSWGEGNYWGLINVGNGDKFFNDCAEHPKLHDENGESLVTLSKAPIINEQYLFNSIDDINSPINVLVGSRKFAEGWNCFRVSIIGLINLGSTKGNKIIQIFGRGVRLKGLRSDGKRENIEHCEDYSEIESTNSSENHLRRLETLNVYSLSKSWLETFLKALDKDLPIVSGPFEINVKPAMVKVGRKKVKFGDYKDKLFAFKIGKNEFDSPLRIVFDSVTRDWHWQYIVKNTNKEGEVPNFSINLDYRTDKSQSGHNLVQQIINILSDNSEFLSIDWLQDRLCVWEKQQRAQIYINKNGELEKSVLKTLLPVVNEVLYDVKLEDRSWDVIERLLDEVQRDLLEKVFHKIRYDIDKRHYRFDTVRQNTRDESGDFIEKYAVTYEFESKKDKEIFDKDKNIKKQLELKLKESGGEYHIYEPLFRESEDKLLKDNKLKKIGISPDKLNLGEKKFLRDIIEYIGNNYSRDHREFYLMRNVESLKSIGLYLEGETRVFYPDFVLWIIDAKSNKSNMVFFDPKGQTGIISEDDLGLTGKDGMNDKVKISSSKELLDLANQLQKHTKSKWDINSFILLRDKSPLGRWKGSSPTDKEMDLAEKMISKGVLRLDWDSKNEIGNDSVPLKDGSSYLSKIFQKVF